MIERLIELSARHRGTVIALALALAAWGAWSMGQIPLDALPDLSDTQVILYSHWERSPDLIEDQVTYPMVTAMQGMPRVKTVRAVSDFGSSFVYVIFEDGTDRYWARARTQEYLAGVPLPPGVRTELGPDATSLGWIFQYALVDDQGKQSPAQLRSTQDYFLRYPLRSVAGVAEVATVGGSVPQYQVTVDAARLRALRLPFSAVVDAVRRSNMETSGRLMEFGGSEYVIRGRGYLKTPRDLEEAVVRGAPGIVRVKDVGKVTVGPDMRRGVADFDGRGDTVSGIVVMRDGANAVTVAAGVRRKLAQLASGLPPGVRVVPVYDRSALVERIMHNLRSTLLEIIVTVVVVILVFLWHPPSAVIPILTIPFTVLAVAVPLHLMDVSFNVMSLGGLAIAAGALTDAAIVVAEQSHKRLEAWQAQGERGDAEEVILRAVKEAGRPAFFALVIMAVAFLPVLALAGQEGRLFHPLVYAKSLTLLIAALFAVTLDPALRLTLARWGRRGIRREEQNPLSLWLIRLYQPVLSYALDHKRVVAGTVVVAAMVTVPAWRSLGTEMIPPVDEGVLLYMPSTVAGVSLTEAKRLLQLTDARLMTLPEVDHVLGKAGRAETATDPAGLSMIETLVVLKPRNQWPRPLSQQQLLAKFDGAMQFPGLANAWTMPIRGRIDMLATGFRSPLGLKIAGPDLRVVQGLGMQVETLLRGMRGTRSVFAERMNDGRYIDIQWDRHELARAGIAMEEAQAAVANAIGGDNVTTVIEGRGRYPVNVRLPRAARDNLDALRQVPVGDGETVPLGQLASVQVVPGPAMIRDEDAGLTGYVYLDIGERDPEDYVREGAALLRARLVLPPGYTLTWSGQYEGYQQLRQRLWRVVPVTLVLMAALLYGSTRSLGNTALVLLAVPFSAIGAVWGLCLLGYPLSPSVWVGMIALLGLDAETGTFMVLYLDLAWSARVLHTREDLREAVMAGAVRRIRPKVMTVATIFLGLVPILWSSGAGAEVMKRIAAPMIGGLVTSFLMELVVYPIVYEQWKARRLVRVRALVC